MQRKKPPRRAVSASELAQMGVCERLVVFEHREGRQPSAQRQAALARGLRAHEEFARQASGGFERRGRCFIATCVYGQGRETALLRALRDRVLRPSRVGRRVILGYYRTAPAVCRVLERWPPLQVLARAALRPVVWLTARWLKARDAG